MSVKSYSLTDIGRQRQLNQDFVFTSEVRVGRLPNLFIVADGMGGYKAGEFASKCTVETVVNEASFLNEKEPIRILNTAIQKANAVVRQKSMSDDNYRGMGTTIVAATFDGNTLCVANVGDSRLYLMSDSLRQITTDHSLVEEMIQMGEIERGKARTHPDKNIITRAIGVANHVDVDFFEVEEIRTGDIIVMCSDGLSNMMEDSVIEGVIKGEGTLKEKATRLVNIANENGGRDNIAVILAELIVDNE